MLQSDGGSKKKPKPSAAQKKAAAARRAKTTAAQKFAANQLTKAGIKPKKAGHGVIAQYSAANKVAAKRRTEKKLGTIAGTGASSSLTAGDKKGLPRPKITAEQFATNQLKKAGIKVAATGDVTKQFRDANKSMAQKRRAAGLAKTSASSSLAAGMKGPKAVKPVKPAKKPSAAKIKAQGLH